MKSLSPSTDTAKRRRRAQVYLDAAHRVETDGCGLACIAIHEVIHDTNFSKPCEARKVFESHLGPTEGDAVESPGWWGYSSDGGLGPRVLALCFMAAMVEAGDA